MSHFSPHHAHPHISRADWREKRWMMGHLPSLILHIHVLSLVSVPLSDHPPSPPRPFPPPGGSGNPLAASSPPPSPFFCFCNSSGRGPFSVAVCCMLALSSSSPLCWHPEEVVGVCGQLTPPCLQPFCSVNPHCLVVLFELT